MSSTDYVLPLVTATVLMASGVDTGAGVDRQLGAAEQDRIRRKQAGKFGSDADRPAGRTTRPIVGKKDTPVTKWTLDSCRVRRWVTYCTIGNWT